MKKIKEVIVVEGKDDTERIKRAVDADTIETRGSAISQETLKLIQKLDQKRGVIIFTDPDFSGERIRRIVSSAVPNAKHAFLLRKDATPKHHDGSLGVEHASVKSIQNALLNVYTENNSAKPVITKKELFQAGLSGDLDAKKRREQLCNLLRIGYVNAKQLPKRMQMFGITKEQFQNAIDQIN
ncbi:ribonuclease M5 1 [Philodulcilactobacillus myokoensis]|uniref:Ribonuclease M5 n=1 Tax=Philodulcilactobacillus myokoensis TaxID=2929573 RepID=A0A9W6B1T7_9LACO|nr:ribonuclease M5 [Philodulcilactobacillus myokoensis]GLB47231.1 ribonuclease M5 1 [Philodulcilactobacillus myokoensis]